MSDNTSAKAGNLCKVCENMCKKCAWQGSYDERCQSCGYLNPPGTRYCQECGSKL